MTEKQMESFLYGVFDILACQASEELQERFTDAFDPGKCEEEDGGEDYYEEAGRAMGDVRWGTFSEEGVLTGNKGLVVRLGDGTEFQITVVKSR